MQRYPYNKQQNSFRYHFTNRQMHRYFFKPPKGYMQVVFLGIAEFILGLAIGTYGIMMHLIPLEYLFAIFAILGLCCLALGGISLLRYNSNQPTAGAYEGWVAERSASLYRTALWKCGLDEQQCKMIVQIEGSGFSSLLPHTARLLEREMVVKRLPNERRHYSINASIYIFLTENEIVIYSGYINTLFQSERFESVDRYYYHDIVSVSLNGPVYTFWDGADEIPMQGLLVKASNGDVIGTDYANRVILLDGGQEKLISIYEVRSKLNYCIHNHKLTAIEANKQARNLP